MLFQRLGSSVISTIIISSTFLIPAYADTLPYDLSVGSRGISFSDNSFYAGDEVRIYGTVDNQGTKDMMGFVQFFKGTTPIGNEIPVSSKAIGAPEEVWVDWIAEEGTYNIQFRIVDSTPHDQNTSNNQTVSTVFTVAARPVPPPPPPTPAPVATQPTSSSTNTSQTTSSGSTSNKSTPTSTPVRHDPGAAIVTYAQENPLGTAENDKKVSVGEDQDSLSEGGTGASVTAVVPETEHNRERKPLVSWDFLNGIDQYTKIMGGSIILIFLLFFAALMFWKKAKTTNEQHHLAHSKKRTPDQALKDFLTPDHHKKS